MYMVFFFFSIIDACLTELFKLFARTYVILFWFGLLFQVTSVHFIERIVICFVHICVIFFAVTLVSGYTFLCCVLK